MAQKTKEDIIITHTIYIDKEGYLDCVGVECNNEEIDVDSIHCPNIAFKTKEGRYVRYLGIGIGLNHCNNCKFSMEYNLNYSPIPELYDNQNIFQYIYNLENKIEDLRIQYQNLENVFMDLKYERDQLKCDLSHERWKVSSMQQKNDFWIEWENNRLNERKRTRERIIKDKELDHFSYYPKDD